MCLRPTFKTEFDDSIHFTGIKLTRFPAQSSKNPRTFDEIPLFFRYSYENHVHVLITASMEGRKIYFSLLCTAPV
jgi:hypothetical protein